MQRVVYGAMGVYGLEIWLPVWFPSRWMLQLSWEHCHKKTKPKGALSSLVPSGSLSLGQGRSQVCWVLVPQAPLSLPTLVLLPTFLHYVFKSRTFPNLLTLLNLNIIKHRLWDRIGYSNLSDTWGCTNYSAWHSCLTGHVKKVQNIGRKHWSVCAWESKA